jgi:stage III sporulation protein AA
VDAVKFVLGNEIYAKITERADYEKITEIRLREGGEVQFKTGMNRSFINYDVTPQVISGVFSRCVGFSPYAHEEEILSGFINIGEGVRVGLSGVTATENGKLSAVKRVTSLNIRIPHDCCCSFQGDDFLNNFKNTLIVGLPFTGKTTLLRHLIRRVSENYECCVIDERGEIFPDGFKRGRLADIYTGIRKDIIYENAIRSLSPEILATDEISPAMTDIKMLEDCARAGVKILATVHGDYETIKKERLASLFSNFICLTNYPKIGTVARLIKG